MSSLYTQGSCAKDNFDCGSYTIYGRNMCGFGALDVWLVRGLETLTPWLRVLPA